MMYTIAAPFALAGPVIAGHLISEYDNNYLTVQMWSGTCLLLSSMCLGAAIFCMRRQDRNESSLEKVRGLASRLFDVESDGIFRSGAVTAVNSRPDTRDASGNEKDNDKE
jgi:hypothetical protein